MRYRATLKVYENPDLIYDGFVAEQAQLAEISRNKRLSFELQNKEDHVEFNISAADPVAMRAAFNSITKGLTVMNKMALLK